MPTSSTSSSPESPNAPTRRGHHWLPGDSTLVPGDGVGAVVCPAAPQPATKHRPRRRGSNRPVARAISHPPSDPAPNDLNTTSIVVNQTEARSHLNLPPWPSHNPPRDPPLLNRTSRRRRRDAVRHSLKLLMERRSVATFGSAAPHSRRRVSGRRRLCSRWTGHPTPGGMAVRASGVRRQAVAALEIGEHTLPFD